MAGGASLFRVQLAVVIRSSFLRQKPVRTGHFYAFSLATILKTSETKYFSHAPPRRNPRSSAFLGFPPLRASSASWARHYPRTDNSGRAFLRAVVADNGFEPQVSRSQRSQPFRRVVSPAMADPSDPDPLDRAPEIGNLAAAHHHAAYARPTQRSQIGAALLLR